MDQMGDSTMGCRQQSKDWQQLLVHCSPSLLSRSQIGSLLQCQTHPSRAAFPTVVLKILRRTKATLPPLTRHERNTVYGHSGFRGRFIGKQAIRRGSGRSLLKNGADISPYQNHQVRGVQQVRRAVQEGSIKH